jgi:hypothetical protein
VWGRKEAVNSEEQNSRRRRKGEEGVIHRARVVVC